MRQSKIRLPLQTAATTKSYTPAKTWSPITDALHNGHSAEMLFHEVNEGEYDGLFTRVENRS